jgi:hypothetical protein
MRALLSLFLTAGLVSAAGLPRSTRAPVTVILEFEKPHSEVSLEAMRQEVQRLMGSAGLKVDFRLRRNLPAYPQFADLVLFKMRGSCSMNTWHPASPLDESQGAPLAMTYSENGQLLHFGEVACDRVRESLQRLLGPGNGRKYESALGNALGIVMAHEMYHMLADTKAHTKQGMTKEALSARELLDGNLTLPRVADRAIEASPDR